MATQNMNDASAWTLHFSTGNNSCQFTVYAYTASQARRKLKATLKQAREGHDSFFSIEGGYAPSLASLDKKDSKLSALDFNGNKMISYSTLDHMIDMAFLIRTKWRDVFFISSLDG